MENFDSISKMMRPIQTRTHAQFQAGKSRGIREERERILEILDSWQSDTFDKEAKGWTYLKTPHALKKIIDQVQQGGDSE